MIHQEIVEYLEWNMDEGVSEIQRLSKHHEYPIGDQLYDLVLLQNKIYTR